MAKIPVGVRLSPVAKRQVELLSENLAISQTAVIETAIRLLARREKITVGGSETTRLEAEGAETKSESETAEKEAIHEEKEAIHE